MTKEKVLIYDDETKIGEEYVERLNELKEVTKVFDVQVLQDGEFLNEMKTLTMRQNNLREGKSWDDSSILDEITIFIIDFDLINPSNPVFMSGEDVAYRTRCFSRCGLIVGMNLVRGNTFDLTLQGNPKSFADLNISSYQLDNPGLWGGETEGFRPWHWPELPKQSIAFQKKVDDAKGHLDMPICAFLDFPKEVVEIFSRTIGEFIGDNPHETTFKDFVTSSPNGLVGRDVKAADNLDEEMMRRIGISRISKWLERLVLPGQDVLVDAPHLVLRYPSLLQGDHKKVDTWNMTAKFETYDKLGLDFETIERFRFKKDYWLSRPAWFSSRISGCQEVKEVHEPWTKEEISFVFCEDSSSFHEKEKCKSFIAQMDSPYDRRFVRKFPDIEYSPKKRLQVD